MRCAEAIAEFLNDLCCMRIGGFNESIVGPLSIATRRDESGATEVCEVARDFRLIRVEDRYAIADAQFLVTEQVNETQPGAVSQGFEKCFQVAAHRILITISKAEQFPVDHGIVVEYFISPSTCGTRAAKR